MFLRKFSSIFRSNKNQQITASSVFATGGVPSITYVERHHLGLEARLADALARKHGFTIISGPTKCGKSVLCQRAMGTKKPITVHGGQVQKPEDFWQHIAHKLDIPGTKLKTRTKTWSFRNLVGISSGIPTIVKKNISADSTSGGQQSEALTYAAVPILDALTAMKDQDTALIIEDFHYIDKSTQRRIVRALKSAVFEGLTVIILAVPHRAFDPADVENEVEGRVHYVEVPRWSENDLSEIAELGFSALSLDIPAPIRRKICEDAFGNPLLMQEICYELSRSLIAPQTNSAPPNAEDLQRCYQNVVEYKGLNRFDRFAQCIVDGAAPPQVELRRGGTETSTMVLLTAVARGGPKSITSYAEIREAFVALSRAEPPSPDRVGILCASMAAVVSVGRAVPLEWLAPTQEMALTDPFLMFYMRWVLRDQRRVALEPSAIENAVGFQPKRDLGNEVGNQ